MTTANGSSQIVRYSCALDANFNATVGRGGTVVLSDDINAAAQGSATITPARFATAAAQGWAPVTASTTVTATTSIPASGTFTLPVNWTSGFDLGPTGNPLPLMLTTSGGFQFITCSGPKITGSTVSGPGTSFTPCSSSAGVTSTSTSGSALTQPASVSAINLAVFQPGSSFNYGLNAVPRAFSSVGISGVGGAGIGSPALLTLGGQDSVQGGANATLTVYGNVNINGGSLTCTGGPFVHAYGFGAISGTSAFTPPSCATGGPTTTQPAVPDPYANIATDPSVLANLHSQLTRNPGGCAPGEYTSIFNCTTVTPGIYQLDQGLGGTSVSCPTCTTTQGVLLYFPPGTESYSTSGNQTINLPDGLSASQSAHYFGTTALQGLVVWQDQGASKPATLGGNSSLGTTLGGTLYFPSADVTVQGGEGSGNINAGRLIAKSLTLAGSANATINPH